MLPWDFHPQWLSPLKEVDKFGWSNSQRVREVWTAGHSEEHLHANAVQKGTLQPEVNDLTLTISKWKEMKDIKENDKKQKDFTEQSAQLFICISHLCIYKSQNRGLIPSKGEGKKPSFIQIGFWTYSANPETYD